MPVRSSAKSGNPAMMEPLFEKRLARPADSRATASMSAHSTEPSREKPHARHNPGRLFPWQYRADSTRAIDLRRDAADEIRASTPHPEAHHHGAASCFCIHFHAAVIGRGKSAGEGGGCQDPAKLADRTGANGLPHGALFHSPSAQRLTREWRSADIAIARTKRNLHTRDRHPGGPGSRSEMRRPDFIGTDVA